MTFQALSIKPDGTRTLQSMAMGTMLSTKGANADVCTFGDTSPNVVGKIYRDAFRKRFSANPQLIERIIILSRQSHELRKALPFCGWPDRLLLAGQAKTSADFAAQFTGFTMDRFPATTSLMELIGVRRARLRLTPHDSVNIAIMLAEQLNKLHQHPLHFVFGDLSPNNVLVSGDFARVLFIDADAFQFSTTVKGRIYTFANDGTTPSYTSPYAIARTEASQLPKEHDLFVLAILIFQILMADRGFLKCHPFSSGTVEENERIKARQFPYGDPTRYPVSAAARKAYESLPSELREAFTDVFMHHRVLTADAWIALLSKHRRCLHGLK